MEDLILLIWIMTESVKVITYVIERIIRPEIQSKPNRGYPYHRIKKKITGMKARRVVATIRVLTKFLYTLKLYSKCQIFVYGAGERT